MDVCADGNLAGWSECVGYLLYMQFLGRRPNPKWYVPFVFLSIAWAISIHTVTAFLYCGLGGRSFWNTALLAPRFLASAFVSGPSFIILVMRILSITMGFTPPTGPARTLIQIIRIAMTVKLIMLASEVFTMFYTGGAHAASARYLFFGLHGHHGLVPWRWTSLACNILGTILFFMPAALECGSVRISACVLCIVVIWIEKGMGLIVPGFIPRTLHEIVEYTPSLTEWKVSAGIWAFGFQAIADYTYDWENRHSPDGKQLWVNTAVKRMTGYAAEECLELADYPLILVAEDDKDKIAAVLRDARAGGSGNDVEFRTFHRDGSMHWAAVSWQPMYDNSKQHLGFRTSVRDVTERHRLREELRLYNQHLEQLVQERSAKIAQLEEQRLKMEKLAALGQMAAGVAHEVNNPLAGIRNAFALFKANLSAADENYELLELIDSEIERISSITHQMYQLYRPSLQTPAKFDLRRVISNVIALLQPVAEKSNVQVTLQIGRCVGHEQLDMTEAVLREGEIRQILLNVIRNAIQASPPSGEVSIDVSTSADHITILVSDRGEGISDEIATRVFEPFFSTKTGTRQGMGLGLSVSRNLVEALGGTIATENSRPSGACVNITLPRQISR